MPRKKSWKKSAAAKRSLCKEHGEDKVPWKDAETSLTIDWTEDPVRLVKKRTNDKKEDPVHLLKKRTNDKKEDPVHLLKKRTKTEDPVHLLKKRTKTEDPVHLLKKRTKTEDPVHLFKKRTKLPKCQNTKLANVQNTSKSAYTKNRAGEMENNNIQGHFNQGHQQFHENSGRQCVANSLVALLLSKIKTLSSWTSIHLDNVLKLGNELYTSLQRFKSVQHRYLLISELPHSVDIFDTTFTLTMSESLTGFVTAAMNEQTDFLIPLQQALQVIMSDYDGSFVTFLEATFIILKDRDADKFCIFDPHSRSADGLLAPDGTSILLYLDTVQEVYDHCLMLLASMNARINTQFEVTGINIRIECPLENEASTLDTEDIVVTEVEMSNLSYCSTNAKQTASKVAHEPGNKYCEQTKYRFHQMSENDTNNQKCTEQTENQSAEHIETCSSEQNKYQIDKENDNANSEKGIDNVNSMKTTNKPDGSTDSNKETVSSSLPMPPVKQLYDSEHGTPERLAAYLKHQKHMAAQKIKLCNDKKSQCSQSEKQQRRNYNREYKRKQRQEKNYRKKEQAKNLVAIKRCRTDEVYKQNERAKNLETKKRCRTDEIFKENERAKNLVAKKRCRTDEIFKENEQAKNLVAMKACRTDENYKQNELAKNLVAKKRLRTDEIFKENERAKNLVAKKRLRTDEIFKENERAKNLVAKKRLRTDEIFKENERAKNLVAKKRCRTDETFKENERAKNLVAKKRLRTDEIFTQKECKRNALYKQKARKSKYFQENERLAKQSSRQNKNQTDKERLCDMESKRSHRQQSSEHQYTEDERLEGLKKVTNHFHKAIATGPVYVCTCCHQTWFRHSVSQVSKTQMFSSSRNQSCKQYLTAYISKDGKEWICKTCLSTIQKEKTPPLSIANKMLFPDKPPELNLHQLEERLVALRIPFMQVRELPRGGQLSIRGNVVNVPVDIQPTIKALPHQLEDTTVPVRLKRKMVYNKCEFTENVRPAHVIAALHWLLRNSELYKNSGIQIDEEWLSKMNNNASEIVKSFTDIPCDEILEIEQSNDDNDGNESDTFSEVDDKETMIGNSDTLIVEACPQTDSTYTFAPGEGQHPLSLYSDTDSEYLSFPSIFCGQRRADNSEREVNVHYSDIAKWELRNVDRRAANSVPNIFYKMKKIQMKQISDKVNLSLRRCKSNDKKVTAAEALNPTAMNKLVNLDEGFYIFRTLRNSPPYLEKRKKDVFAMIRQLGLPTWFASLSAGDTRWHDLLRILGELNDNVSYTDEEIEQMSWNDKTRLVQKDPVTCSRYFEHRVQQFINIVLKSEHAPIGILKDYFYRVEFQNRGSPHIHMLMWIQDAPKYSVNTNEEIAEYVEQHTSCQLNVDYSVSKLVAIQTHKHSKMCRRKGKPVCRFGFPLPPMAKTMVLEPLDADSSTCKQKYVEIQNRLNNCTGLDTMTYDDFLKDVAQTSEEEYIKCIRSSLISPKVFLKRNPSETRINPYMTSLLATWKANHDLQFVLDPYACAVYIVAYISKSQRGMSTLLDEACKQARNGNMNIKQQVRHMGNKFLNSVEVSAQEAAYLVLQMPLTKASREVVFINTSAATERIFLLKQKEALEDLPPESTDIEADNVIKRYSKRPKQLQNMCLADYVSELDIKYPREKKLTEEVNDDDLAESESDDEDEETDLSEYWNKITLKNGIVIKRRKVQKVIRYVRYNIKTDSENHFREKLLLFLPWRNEETDLLGRFDTYQDHYNHIKQSICDKITHYEHHSNELDLALQRAECDLSEQFDNIAPLTQHAEEEDLDEGSQESGQFIYYKPVSGQHKDYDIGIDLGMSHSIPHVESTTAILPNNEYLELVRKLNVKQREFFIHVLHWIKTNNEPLYAFMTGGAGVGKSLVITALYQALRRYLCSFEGENPDDCKILLCAPTGKAAYNIGGTTIHAAFKIRPNQGYGNYTVDSDTLNTLRVKYKNLSIVIIDEVSMVGNKMLQLVNECLQRIKGNQNQLFGGVSVILIGDLYQLKPVMDKWIFEDLNEQMGPLATNLWKSLFTMHELTEIMRQKDDKDFAELLNRLRCLENDKLSDADLKCLESRVVKPDDPNYPLTAPHLYTTNDQVDSFNNKMFNNAKMEKVTIPSLDTAVGDLQPAVKDRLIKALPQTITKTAGLPSRLLVAVDMAYDVTANLDILDGLVNGASCYVKMIDYRQQGTDRPSILWVQFDEESIGKQRRRTYKHLRTQNMPEIWTPIFDTQRTFLYNRKTFIRIQFPLRPAAAKTIHKSQGSTLNDVAVDMSSKRKQPHMHYVAFSRVRNMSNLYILNLNVDKISVDAAVKLEMERLKKEAKLQLCYNPPYTVSSDKLKVAFLNTRSLQLHYNDVKNDHNVIATDIMAFAETRLKTSDSNEDFTLHGFQLHRNDERNTSKPHHGLAVYFRNDIQVLHVDFFSSFEFECIVARVKKSDMYLQLAVVYKSPQCTVSKLREAIEMHIKPKILTDQNFVIIGDFNNDVPTNNIFLDWMEELFRCKQIVSSFTTDQKSILDLIFTNVDDACSGVVECCWTDHKMVYCAM